MFAGTQAAVEWQSSQVLPLDTWVGDFPAADVPLWQLEQVPVIVL
jgi:hypothetical protein